MARRFALDIRHLRDFGIGTYIRNLVHGLARVDSENEYILVCRPQDTHELDGLPANFHPTEYTEASTSLTDWLRFSLFLRHQATDLVHIPLQLVPPLMPRPYVLTVHDLSTLLYDTQVGLRANLHQYWFRKGLSQAARIIAVSDATRRDVEELLGIPPSRIRQIYNAPDIRFSLPARAADARSAGPDREGLELKRILERYQIHYPFLLYAGTIRPQKNIPRLVEAFAVLRGDLENHPVYKDLHLVIIGDEISKYPQVRRAVIQTRVEPVVRFLGFVPFDTLRVFYTAASAFVFPSFYEGFGLPPLEAMSSGTPVVTSNVSSLPEVVGDAAVMVNPENVFDIARGIREVLLDTGLRERLVEKGHQQVRRFSWDRTAKEVLTTYLEVIAPRKQPE